MTGEYGDRLKGRVAFITGAAKGERAALGEAYAKVLAAAGAAVAVADVKDCTDVAQEIEDAGGKALALTIDVTDESQLNGAVAQITDKFGRLDIVIPNAAIGSNIPPVPVTELSGAAWDELMAINVKGVFLTIKAAVPVMRAQKYGKIVNIGSTTMMTGLVNRLHYVTAKGAILAMTRSLAQELGPDGIRVNTFAYGLVTSRLNEAEFAENPEFEKMVLGWRALGTHVRAEDLAGTMVYLASADSDHMTGQTIVVDGGQYFY